MQAPLALGLGTLRAPSVSPLHSTSTTRPVRTAHPRLPPLTLQSEFHGCHIRPQSLVPHSVSCPRRAPSINALLELSGPAAAKWGLRLVSFYALLRLGIAKEVKGGAIDNAQSFLMKQLFGDAEARSEKDARKATTKWKETTKGTLVRKLRVPSVSQGRKLLNAVAGVLSDDDLFVDVASHKGCQIRRETAHSESVCCYNVRALFDELPTPHLEVEITVFPRGPLTAKEYQKAQKLEAVLKKGNSI